MSLALDFSAPRILSFHSHLLVRLDSCGCVNVAGLRKKRTGTTSVNKTKRGSGFPEPHDHSFIQRDEARSFVMAGQTELTATDIDDQAVRRRTGSSFRLVDVVAGRAFDILIGQPGQRAGPEHIGRQTSRSIQRRIRRERRRIIYANRMHAGQ